MRPFMVGTWLALAIAGCAARHSVGPAAAHQAPLELLGEVIVPAASSADRLGSARFGGVSGLTMDPSTGELLGICDDSNDTRVFVFRTSSNARPFRVDLTAYFPLPAGQGSPAALDPEAIAITRGGRLFVASEGIGNRDPRVPPAIVEYTRGVEYVGQLTVPAKFIPPASGPLTRGVRANAAFESLALTPDEKHLFTATETALAQDGDPADMQHGTSSRMIEYETRGGTYEPRREFAYPIDALAKPDFTPGFFINGLVELLALSDTEFLSMERGYAEEPGGKGRMMNRIRIFRTSIDGATDISGFDSIRGRRDITPMRKTLLLDLSDLTGLSPALAGLDNFEGMTFGPTLPDGSRTLLIVSDDNFSARQHTAFLLFRLGPGVRQS